MPHVNLNEVELYYEEVGAGEPVIFLHSSFSRGILSFAAQINEFQNEYRCIFPDFRCHGRSKAKQLDWQMPELAEDIIQLMDHLKISRARVIGFSLGGAVAFYLAVRHPERVQAFISIGAAAQINEMLLNKADDLEPEVLLRKDRSKFVELAKTNHAEAHEGNWEDFIKSTLKNWRTYPAFTDEEFRSIAVPCQLIVGDQDATILKVEIEKLKRLVGHIEISIIEDCGHGPHYIFEKPLMVNQLMMEFLRSHELGFDRIQSQREPNN